MKTIICTGWSPKGYIDYAQRFVDTFERFWPKDVRILAYVEEEKPLARIECRSLWDCAGASEFFERHKDNEEARGLKPNKLWREKDIAAEYSWRMDALKWFRQCLIPNHAAMSADDGDLLVWFDADVMTTGDVPPGLVRALIRGADLAYLGRNGHSEIGFYALRMSPVTREFLQAFADTWTTDRVFTEKQWHSAYIFDRRREEFEQRGLCALNLTPDGKGHVWPACAELARYTNHLKGKRKYALK